MIASYQNNHSVNDVLLSKDLFLKKTRRIISNRTTIGNPNCSPPKGQIKGIAAIRNHKMR